MLRIRQEVNDRKSFSHNSKEEDEHSLLGSASIIPKNTVDLSHHSESKDLEERKAERMLINEDSRIISHDFRESQDYEDPNESDSDDHHAHSVQNDEKPIASTKMTFEEMLEQQLECGQEPAEPLRNRIPAKKDFLRKNSNPRNTFPSVDKSKPGQKFKYYADNFKDEKEKPIEKKESSASKKDESAVKKEVQN